MGALTGAGEDGKPGRLDGTTTYFKKSTITISGLTGDCMTRLNARKGKFSYSPGTYAAYAEGDGNIPDDDDLEDYNSGWKLSTGATVSYSDLPDGYFFFTASCTSPYTTSDDFMFKIGACPLRAAPFADSGCVALACVSCKRALCEAGELGYAPMVSNLKCQRLRGPRRTLRGDMSKAVLRVPEESS